MEVRKKRFIEGLKRLVVEELNRLSPNIASFMEINFNCKQSKWCLYYSANFDVHLEFERKYKNQLIHIIKKKYCKISEAPVKHLEVVYLGIHEELIDSSNKNEDS